MASYHTITVSARDDLLQLDSSEPRPRIPDLDIMDSFQSDLAFETGSLYDNSNPPIPPFTPSYDMETFSTTTFEDPFSSYQARGGYGAVMEENNNEPPESLSSPDPDPDDKLLGFGAPTHKLTAFDETGQTWPTMTAELMGMFFIAESVFGQESTGRPLELTCYRRNLFQISGTIGLSRSLNSILADHGQTVPIYNMMATLSAVESIEGKPTEIIAVPWKSASGNSSDDKAGTAPLPYPLDLSLNQELDGNLTTIPISWKRLQFKHATANNGRRKGLQQHYVVHINLVATLATGEIVSLTEIQSGPIIVRGRSPRNFDSRKDVQVMERRVEPTNRNRPSSGSSPPVQRSDSSNSQSSNNGQNNSYKYYALNQLRQPLDLPEWRTAPSNRQDNHQAKKFGLLTSPSSSHPLPPVPPPQWDIKPNIKDLNSTPSQSSSTGPINLKLTDEEFGTNRKEPSQKSHPLGLSQTDFPSPVQSRSTKTASSPVESADLLYEYFPLSVDDWMPPVDAIYRPHVVHHTIVPPELKAQQVKSKSKRYFSADD